MRRATSPPTKVPPPDSRSAVAGRDRRASDDADVQRFVTLTARADVELDLLAFLERAIARTLDLGVVDEDIWTLLAGDETEALLGVEELHRACCQRILFSSLGPIPAMGPTSTL